MLAYLEMRTITTRKGYSITVDDADFESLSAFKWQVIKIKGYRYAFRDEYTAPRKYRRIFMHRQIMGLLYGDRRLVDHEDHDGLNNRRSNLRVCCHKRNGANRKKLLPYTSKFKGVCYHKGDRKWQAQIMVDQKEIYLGSYASEEAAALAYNQAAVVHFGEFALLNPLSPQLP